MTPRADAHMHLFEHGYQDAFTARPGVHIDELACYQSLMTEHDIQAALVIGYQGATWCQGNNDYLAARRPEHPWLHPTAFVDPSHPPAVSDLAARQAQGFVGISLYVTDQSTRQAIQQMPGAVWSWLASHRWVISVNTRPRWAPVWLPILDAHENLRLIISHLGLPPRVASPPEHDQAVSALSPITRLADYPNTHVKLSAFYAISDPGHDYPHHAAKPYVNLLGQAFGADRLLWGSDFSPCLDQVTFPQTCDTLAAMTDFSDAELANIHGLNLLKLLKEAGA